MRILYEEESVLRQILVAKRVAKTENKIISAIYVTDAEYKQLEIEIWRATFGEWCCGLPSSVEGIIIKREGDK